MPGKTKTLVQKSNGVMKVNYIVSEFHWKLYKYIYAWRALFFICCWCCCCCCKINALFNVQKVAFKPNFEPMFASEKINMNEIILKRSSCEFSSVNTNHNGYGTKISLSSFFVFIGFFSRLLLFWLDQLNLSVWYIYHPQATLQLCIPRIHFV